VPTAKRGLGRGLEALLPDLEARPGDAVRRIPCDRIDPNPHQPRREIDEEKLEELAASIRQHGVLQPVILRGAGERYQLVAGERRWRAAVRAGLDVVPGVVRDFDDAEMMEVALIENLQREDLNPLEEARAYQALIDGFGLSQEEVAQRLGRSRPAITNALRLLGLEPEIQAGVAQGRLTAGHARALLAAPDRATRLRLAERVVGEGLSVREVERLVRSRRQRTRGGVRQRPGGLSEIEERLREALGTRVRVRPGRRKGVIEIEYFGGDDLERLVELLAGPFHVKP
jgi:ParB family chromosome partitioning protein